MSIPNTDCDCCPTGVCPPYLCCDGTFQIPETLYATGYNFPFLWNFLNQTLLFKFNNPVFPVNEGSWTATYTSAPPVGPQQQIWRGYCPANLLNPDGSYGLFNNAFDGSVYGYPAGVGNICSVLWGIDWATLSGPLYPRITSCSPFMGIIPVGALTLRTRSCFFPFPQTVVPNSAYVIISESPPLSARGRVASVGGGAPVSPKGTRPQPGLIELPVRPQECRHLGRRTEFRSGCGGWSCRHDCDLGLPAVPGGYCQTCPKYET